MGHKEFKYGELKEVVEDAMALGVKLKFSDKLEILSRKAKIDGFDLPNALAVHPMEGADGELDGAPGELTKRRYERFSRGGAGLLWFEAVAVVPEGRANPRQLWIHANNLPQFQKLATAMLQQAQEEHGSGHTPMLIMQLTHSGRYSKPYNKPVPILAARNPYLDAAQKLNDDVPILFDDELEKLEDHYVKAAVLAHKAGFHGVDIKCCHRYLNSELLSAFTRKGRYGETFEGRTRFLLNVVRKIKDCLGKDFIVTTRLNIYDAIPYPYGWGVDKADFLQYDLSEPKLLVKLLWESGVKIVNLTMGNPYYNPHVNRPYDKGPYTPPEHPLVGVARLINGIGEIQKDIPQMAVVGTGFSWLRQFSASLAAGTLEDGLATIIGYGRESFAYPDFAKDIIKNGSLIKEKCCIACGKCTDIMRSGGTTGCAIKDSKIYAPIYGKVCRNG